MVEEKIYTIPLRKEFLKAKRYRRTKRAVKAVREFLERHMRSKNVKIGKYLNKKLLERGRKNPIHKIQVKVWKDKDVVKAELVNAPVEEKKEEKKKITERIKEKLTGKETKIEKGTEEKKEEEKKEVLKKEVKKKERVVEGAKDKFLEKEKTMLAKEENLYPKTQKPKHERK